MAEVNFSFRKSFRGVPRAKRLSTKVDLTPMVDLGFLLISFFIVTTTLALPRTMPLVTPASGDSTNISKAVVLTLIASANGKVFYYQGQFEDALRNNNYGTGEYSKNNGIREIIEEKQVEMDKSYHGGRREMIVLIKASPEASYENVVQLLDEMTIDGVKRYSLVEMTDLEKKFLLQHPLIN
jgi:biopolymer transport protein ExbD